MGWAERRGLWVTSELRSCSGCQTTYDAFKSPTCPGCGRDDRSPRGARDPLEIAQDPTSPDDELGKLAFSNDPLVQAAVLANPNTPSWARNRMTARGPTAAVHEGPTGARLAPNMVTTADSLPGYDVIRSLGIVAVAASKMALGWNRQSTRLSSVVNTSLTELLDDARTKGANAVIGLRIAINNSAGSLGPSGSSEGAVLMGTAVTVRRQVEPSTADALKSCPTCREQVHAWARKCRYCLEWFPTDRDVNN